MNHLPNSYGASKQPQATGTSGARLADHLEVHASDDQPTAGGSDVMPDDTQAARRITYSDASPGIPGFPAGTSTHDKLVIDPYILWCEESGGCLR